MSKDYELKLLTAIKAVAGEENLEDNYLRIRKIMDEYAISQNAIAIDAARSIAYDEGYEQGYTDGSEITGQFND